MFAVELPQPLPCQLPTCLLLVLQEENGAFLFLHIFGEQFQWQNPNPEPYLQELENFPVLPGKQLGKMPCCQQTNVHGYPHSTSAAYAV